MSDQIVPAAVQLAAKRGFVRTTTQAYAATLATGISTTVALGLVTGEVQLVPTIVTGAVALLSPLLAGLASYLSIISKGVPEEYIAAGNATPKTDA